MWFETALGEEVKIRAGDVVYVDEGDSSGQMEFTARVLNVTPEHVVLEDGRRFRPDRMVDVQVVAR